MFNQSRYVCFEIQIDAHARITSPTATVICSFISWSNGIVNPLIYIIQRKNYREEVKLLLKDVLCIGHCTKRSLNQNKEPESMNDTTKCVKVTQMKTQS